MKDKSIKTPIDAIRLYCKQCSGGVKSEVVNCPVKSCPLYDFRVDAPQLESISIEKTEESTVEKKPVKMIDIQIDEDF